MRPFKEKIRHMAQVVLSRFGGRTLPVLTGPLKGKRLPKSIALRYFRMLWGNYEAEVVAHLLPLVKPWTIAYDVGANIGYFTLAFAGEIKEGKIFAFEPVPENQVSLWQTVSSNRLEERVVVVPKALSNLNGHQNMYLLESSMCFLEAARDGQKVNDVGKLRVESCTLDTFVFEKNNPPPHILKIDVEGAELLVLEGGLRTLEEFRPRILMEIHGPRNAQEIWRLLKEIPYFCWHLTLQGKEWVPSEEKLLSLFSATSWTSHFLLGPP